MAAGGEDFGDARHFEARFGEAENRAQTRAAGTDNHHVIRMVNERITAHAALPSATLSTDSTAYAASNQCTNCVTMSAANFLLFDGT